MHFKPAKGEFSLSLGDRGEMIAGGYLVEKGYEIIDKKVRASFGEIDLIARKDSYLIFVEVKTRSTEQFGLPAEAVDEKKQKQVAKLAEWYLQKTNLYQTKVRFDVIAILYDGFSKPQIHHIQNAFDA